MKKLQVLAFSLLLLAFVNVNATTLPVSGTMLAAGDFSFDNSGSNSFNLTNTAYSPSFEDKSSFLVFGNGTGFDLNLSGSFADMSVLIVTIVRNGFNQKIIFENSFNITIADFFVDGVSGTYSYDIYIVGATAGSYVMDVSAVPLPAAALLFGTAFLGFVGFSSRRKSSAKVAEQGLAV